MRRHRRQFGIVVCLFVMGSWTLSFISPLMKKHIGAVTAIVPGLSQQAMAAEATQPPTPTVLRANIETAAFSTVIFVVSSVGGVLITSFINSFNKTNDIQFDRTNKEFARINKELESINQKLEQLSEQVITKRDVVMTVATAVVSVGLSQFVLPFFARE
mmetsp:Transcript_13026/g.24632  ORF Transcript_13026/g.24632 Transcript_13026/m.24632 type:complete len:159 (+) Transcript_13026:56-532(+)